MRNFIELLEEYVVFAIAPFGYFVLDFVQGLANDRIGGVLILR